MWFRMFHIPSQSVHVARTGVGRFSNRMTFLPVSGVPKQNLSRRLNKRQHDLRAHNLSKLIEATEFNQTNPGDLVALNANDFYFQNRRCDTLLHAIGKSGSGKAFSEVEMQFSSSPGEFAALLCSQNLYGASPLYYMAANAHDHLLERISEFFKHDLAELKHASCLVRPDEYLQKDPMLLNLYLACNRPTVYGVTPLLASINAGHSKPAQILLNDFHVTGLDLEFYHPKNLESRNSKCESPENIKQQLFDNPLAAAIRQGSDIAFIEYMIKHYDCYLDNTTTSHVFLKEKVQAIYFHRFDVDKNVKPGANDNLSKTLQIAAQLGSESVFEKLLETAEKLGVLRELLLSESLMYDYCGTPLHAAASAGSIRVIEKIHQKLSDLDKLWLKTYFSRRTTGGRIPLDLAYRALRSVRGCYSQDGNEEGITEEGACESHEEDFKKSYDFFKKVYCDYSEDEKEPVRNRVISRISNKEKTSFDEEFGPKDFSSWQVIRHLDERLFVGQHSDEFIQRINNTLCIKPSLFWLKKSIYAARTMNFEAFKYTISRIDDYTVSDSYGFTALHWAAYIGCVEWTHNIIGGVNRLNPDIKIIESKLDAKTGYSGTTPLFEAVYFSHNRLIMDLRAAGANFENSRKYTGSFPLNLMIWLKNVGLAYQIISSKKGVDYKETGFNWNKVDSLHRGLIYLCVVMLLDNANFLKLKIKSENKISPSDNLNKDFYGRNEAIKNKAIQLIQFLVDKEANPCLDARPWGEIPSLIRLGSKADKFVKLDLLSGETPLHLAAKIPEEFDFQGNSIPTENQLSVRVGSLLVRAVYNSERNQNAGRSGLNSQGLSPMHIACQFGNEPFLDMLMENRVNPFVYSADGRQPISMITYSDPEKFMRIRVKLEKYMKTYERSGQYSDYVDDGCVPFESNNSVRFRP